MSKIVQHGYRVFVEEYGLVFTSANGGPDYSFPCDKNGNLDPYDMQNGQRDRYFLISHDRNYTSHIEDCSYSYFENAIVECDCGQHVVLYDSLDNFCTCGRCYNRVGQLVHPHFPAYFNED